MNADVAQLRLLARQAGASAGARRSDSTRTTRTSVADVEQLRRVLRLRIPAAAVRRADAADRVLPGTRIAPGLRLVTAARPGWALPPSLDGTFDRRGDFDPRRVLFFDTETTGLAGGTGTRAFMIGVAQWCGGALQIRQLVLESLAGEAAMLAEFAHWLAPGTVLVSYNGKSYDSPLLRTRYRLARQPDPLAGLEHVDLLYPARRRYRGRFENCRLVTIERRVLHIVREDDLPGSEAPAAWLGYLRGGASTNLCRVAAHNQQDVASLAHLLLHLAA